MPYRGPGVRPRDPREGRPDVSEQLARAIDTYVRGKEAARLRTQADEDRARSQELEDFELRTSVEADPRYTLDRPQDVATRRPDVTRGSGLGMAGGRAEGVPSIFEGARFPMGTRNHSGVIEHVDTGADFADLLEAAAPRAETPPDRPRYLPGQFVRGLGYTERPIFDAPLTLQSELMDEIQPEPVEPFATVRGMEVFRDPGYMDPREEREHDLGSLIETIGRARGGDEAARDRLLATDPELYEFVTEGSTDVGYRTRLADLGRRGLDPTEAEAIARDEVAYRAYLDDLRATDAEGRRSDAQGLIGRRAVITGALGALQRVNDFYRRGDSRGSYATTGEDYQRDVAAALAPYGYTSLDELQRDARALRTMDLAKYGVPAEETTAPPPDDAHVGSREYYGEPTPPIVLTPSTRAPLRRPAPPVEQPAPEIEDSARALVREHGWDDATARENLRRAGFGRDEIDRILGAGGA